MRLSEIEDGSLYLDSNVLIYLYENNPGLSGAAEYFRIKSEAGLFRSMTSLLSLTEVLVHPLRFSDDRLANLYRELFESPTILKVLPYDTETAYEAARISARYGTKLPDSVQIASARIARADYFVTADLALQRVDAVNVVLFR